MIFDTEKARTSLNSAEKNGKMLVLALIIITVFVVYILKLFSMQVVEGEKYRSQSKNMSSKIRTIPAQRGEIFDRNADYPLVVNVNSFAIDVTPGQIPADRYDTMTARLAGFLGMKKSDIDKKIRPVRNSFTAVEIKANLPFEIISDIAENSFDLPGVSWRSKPNRYYMETGSMSHVLGYTGDITKDEINMMWNQGYTATSVIGKSGIEKQYDNLLQGVAGKESWVVDAKGRTISAKPQIDPPQSGKSLVLTIDTRIQKLAETALGERVGAVVVLKPASGEILAMVSYPYFDANIFNTDDSASQYQKIARQKNQPFLNRAVDAEYPPASTFKTIMSTAMLAEKAFPSNKTIECSGRIVYGGRVFNCHKKYPGHGWLDLKNALAQSCDVYYWIVGRDFLGVDTISSYAREFGFGQSLEIDLPSQKSGFVPTAQWKERRYHEKWVDGDTMNMSIGQGYTLVTPLHIADMMAMVCNSGTIYKPHLLKEVRSPGTEAQVLEKIEPEVLHQSNVDRAVWREVQNALRYTITDGSAEYPMHNRFIQIAGKTGTAEVNGYGKDHWHSWMVAYAPFDAPVDQQIIVVTLVEAVNDWEWWAPYCTNIILQGIFANQTYDQAITTLGFRYLMKSNVRRE